MLALPPIVKLNVGGTIFLTASSTLLSCPHEEQPTYFSQAFGNVSLPVDNNGAYFIDRDPTYFRHILNWLRTGKWCPQPFSEDELSELISEAEYYALSAFVRKLQSFPKPPPAPVTIFGVRVFNKPEQKTSGTFMGTFPADNYPRHNLALWLTSVSTTPGFDLVSVHCDSMDSVLNPIVVIYKMHKIN